MTITGQFTSTPARVAERGATLLATIFVITTTSLGLGVLTAWGQGTIDRSAYLLVDSAGPWVLAAAALAMLTRTSYGAVAAGVTSLALLELGYVAGAQALGYASSAASAGFWLTAAVLAGPAVGLAGHWLRRGDAVRAALGAGLIGGALIGEAVYFRTQLGALRYPEAEFAVAAALLLGAAHWRFPRPAPMALALISCGPSAVLVLHFLQRAGG